jgi:hypothetical protein
MTPASLTTYLNKPQPPWPALKQKAREKFPRFYDDTIGIRFKA